MTLHRLFAGSILKCRINKTLHGLSVYRKALVRQHNVIKGYLHPGTGDALDIFLDKGTPVFASHNGQVARMTAKAGVLDACYLQGEVDGKEVLVIYAHLHYVQGVCEGAYLEAGETIGWVAGEVKDPHLHLEVWIGGVAITAPTARKLAAKFGILFTAK